MRRRAACPDVPPTTVKMSPYDTIELLANLDFVVEKLREASGWPARPDVLRMLQPRLRKRHTSRQIESKLKSLIRSADPKTIQDVYRYGSSRMESLDDDLKLKVQEELKVIKSEEVCIVVSTPRKLRNVSRTPATETSRSKRESTLFSERTPTRSASRNLATEASRFKRESTFFGERTPTRTRRKTQRGESQARMAKLAESQRLSRKVRNRSESWRQQL